jgi:hypothetical protein
MDKVESGVLYEIHATAAWHNSRRTVETVISVRSVQRCYKQTVNGMNSVELSEVERVGWWVNELEDCCGSVLVSYCSYKLVAETWGHFRNPEEGERQSLEAFTRRMVKTQQTEKIQKCVVVNCIVCELAILCSYLQLPSVRVQQSQLPIQTPSVITHTRDNIYIYIQQLTNVHVRWIPCHHGMARPQVTDGGNGLQIWRLDASILNKQSRRADKGWSSSLGVGRGANNSSP